MCSRKEEHLAGRTTCDCLLVLLALVWFCEVRAATVAVPNASFESPGTFYASPALDFWQKAPKPDWYIEEGGFTWDQLAGQFKNTSLTSADHIDNCDGAYAAFLFAVPEVALFQDYESTDWSHTNALHAFGPVFDPGKTYHFALGIMGGGGGMLEGATLDLGFYYRDSASNIVSITTVTVTNTISVFSNDTHFLDFRADLSVRPQDPWAGKHIGLQILSSVSMDYTNGGYWDLDNVRLTATLDPRFLSSGVTNGHFGCSLQGEPGFTLEILSANDPTVPVSAWSSAGFVTNGTGTAVFTDTGAMASHRFYRARQAQ
ncbi:MAG TPA: hypothetical protein VLT36_23530 [Candidatus Dormibacteraeota bacterium]|nr:hypothetical protein [Candidatus Dormibacteraeota bacterium]